MPVPLLLVLCLRASPALAAADAPAAPVASPPPAAAPAAPAPSAAPGAAPGTAPGSAPAPLARLDGSALVPSVPVTFGAGAAVPSAESGRALDELAAFLAAKSYVSTLRVEGHVAEGTADAQALSERRALAAARALVARGVECGRLLAVGFGATKPVADGATPEGRAANTRVAFVSAALRGRAIGGLPLDGGGPSAGDVCAAK